MAMDAIHKHWVEKLPPEELATMTGPPPTSWDQRLQPLIKDITQLSTTRYLQQMRLHPDGTAEYPQQEMWIYIGDTPSTRTNDFTQKKGSCKDPQYICDGYNDAFNQLLEFFHTHRTNTTSNAGLTFVDCDVSPLICGSWTGWAVDPVLLAHVKTSSPCRTKWPEFEMSCTVTWRFVGLPLKKMPWTPTKRFPIDGKPGRFTAPVPVFPSYFEQVKALVGYRDSEEALDYLEHEIEVYSPDLDDEAKQPMGGEGEVLRAEEKSELGKKGFYEVDDLPWIAKAMFFSGCYSALAWTKVRDLWNGVVSEPQSCPTTL